MAPSAFAPLVVIPEGNLRFAFAFAVAVAFAFAFAFLVVIPEGNLRFAVAAAFAVAFSFAFLVVIPAGNLLFDRSAPQAPRSANPESPAEVFAGVEQHTVARPAPYLRSQRTEGARLQPCHHPRRNHAASAAEVSLTPPAQAATLQAATPPRQARP